MLRVGVIGYGNRIQHMVPRMRKFNIPFRVAAVADPLSEKIRAANDYALTKTHFYSTAEEMLENENLNGVMIGTRCRLHAEMACKVAPYNLPLFVEKPVAITFEQLKLLDKTFAKVTAPTVVSFSLRVSPLLTTVKEIVDSGQIGTIEQMVAFNDVAYGEVYFSLWYRNHEETGGLFLQKATHDLDYLYYLVGAKPKSICAMKAQRFYGGDKPFDLRCEDCDEYEQCMESPFNWFYKRKFYSFVGEDEHLKKRMCVYSKGIENQDIGECIIEYENGVQAAYTQNFFVRNQAGRRGARIYGRKGTIAFDWRKSQIKVFSHVTPKVDTIDFPTPGEHFGGDLELSYDFLTAMRDGKTSRVSIQDGILSALTCLWARVSAENRTFCEVKMPE